ncbi:Cytochrome c oxidase assembly protein COX16, partial [Colletotrichum gloeosporioides]
SEDVDVVVSAATGSTDYHCTSSRQLNTVRNPAATMAVFDSKKFKSSVDTNNFAARYRAMMAKRPFLLFGLPFVAVMVAGSFVLTPATAIRYEKHDRRVRQMTRDEELSMRRSARKVDMKEEYYRLAAKDIDNWEQKRVKRFKGEHDGIIE